MKRQWCVDSTNLSETWNLQIGQFQNDMHVGHGRLFLRPQATIIYNFHKNQQIKVEELMSQKLILQYPFNSMFKYETFSLTSFSTHHVNTYMSNMVGATCGAEV